MNMLWALGSSRCPARAPPQQSQYFLMLSPRAEQHVVAACQMLASRILVGKHDHITRFGSAPQDRGIAEAYHLLPKVILDYYLAGVRT
jgi:hypothetical protein